MKNDIFFLWVKFLDTSVQFKVQQLCATKKSPVVGHRKGLQIGGNLVVVVVVVHEMGVIWAIGA